MKATQKKIENVRNMFNEYVAFCKEDREMIDNIETALDRYEWVKHNDELEAKEKKVRAAVRKLAKDLGFELRTKLHYDCDIEDTIEAIENQFKKALRAFYEIGCNGN